MIINFILILSICFALSYFIVNSAKFGNLIKKVFYVPATKSSTGAVLLGGIPVAIGSAAVFAQLTNSLLEFATWALPALILVSIGYLDDKIEIKAYVKLSLQVLAIFSFSYLTISSFSSEGNLALFGIYLFWGFGVLSGSNLLDGIDTYSIKYSTGTYLVFSALSFYSGETALAATSLTLIAPMLAFYYFNKFPSKLHLGEIGGTIIGLNFLFLSSLFYKSQALSSSGGVGINFEVLFLSLSIMHLPMTELGISLLRRTSCLKSPFHGDKLHLHYILSAKKSIGVVKAANILSSLHLQALAINIAIGFTVSFTASFLASGIFYVGYYIFLGFESWSSEYTYARAIKLENVYPIRAELKHNYNLVGNEELSVDPAVAVYEEDIKQAS